MEKWQTSPIFSTPSVHTWNWPFLCRHTENHLGELRDFSSDYNRAPEPTWSETINLCSLFFSCYNLQPQSGGREGEGEKGSSKLDLTFQRDITTSAQCLYIVKDEQGCVLVVWYHLGPGETCIWRKKITRMCLAKGSGSRSSSVHF